MKYGHNEWWPHLKAQLNDCTGSNQLFEWTWQFQHHFATKSIYFFHYFIQFVFFSVDSNICRTNEKDRGKDKDRDRDRAHWIGHQDKLIKNPENSFQLKEESLSIFEHLVFIWRVLGVIVDSAAIHMRSCACVCVWVWVWVQVWVLIVVPIRMNKHDIVFQKVHRIVCKIAHECMVSNGFTRIVLRKITNGPMQSNKSLTF